jgi:hypothetical protein
VNPSFAAIENAEAESWAEILENVAPAFRKRFDLRVQRVAGAIIVLAPIGEDIASLNRVWLPGDAPNVTGAVLKEIMEHARTLGRSRFIAHCPTWAAPPDFMIRHGFRQRPSMFKLTRRTSDDVPESALRVEEIGSSEASVFGRLAAEGNAPEADDQGIFKQPWMADAFNSTVGLPGWKHYFVHIDDAPVATAGLRVREGVAWCCLASTLPAFRGRGAQLALLHRRIRDAAKAGCEWIVVEAFADSSSFRNQQRAGFEVVYERPNYVAELTT